MSVVEQVEIEVPVVSDEEARRREILLRAAEIIERGGWSDGSKSMTPDGPLCIMGAVGKAMGAPIKLSMYSKTYQYSYSVVGEVLGSDEDPWRWNDDVKPGGARVARYCVRWRTARRSTKRLATRRRSMTDDPAVPELDRISEAFPADQASGA